MLSVYVIFSYVLVSLCFCLVIFLCYSIVLVLAMFTQNMDAFLIIALQKALETKLSELDTTNRNQTSELMSTLKNVKEKLQEKEVFKLIILMFMSYSP